MNSLNGIKKHIDFLILDLLSLIVAFIAAYYIRFNNFNFIYIDIYKEMMVIFVLVELLLSVFISPFTNVLKRGYLIELKETIKYVVLSGLFSITYLFIIKSSSKYSRIVLFLTYFLYLVISYFIRILWKKHIKKNLNSKKKKKSLLVVLKENNVEEILSKLNNDNLDYYICGLCVVDKNLINNQLHGINVVANKNSILDYISRNWVDEIFIAGNYKILSKKTIENINITGITIRFMVDDIPDISGRKQLIENFKEFKTITTVNREYSESEVFIKRMIDICAAMVGCLLTIVFALIIGPIIYIKSPGPIIYISNRIGKNGRVFRFYKFRSMILNADDKKEELQAKNRNKDGMMFKIEDDPRIIPGIGKFIRRTSIDEFPQFFNVLKGDMSLVGTRPPTLDEWNKYTPYYRSRLSIKPGITGLWQISGRSNITDFNEVVKLDNEYINNWSIELDIKILLKTVIQLFDRNDNGSM